MIQSGLSTRKEKTHLINFKKKFICHPHPDRTTKYASDELRFMGTEYRRGSGLLTHHSLLNPHCFHGKKIAAFQYQFKSFTVKIFIDL